MVTWALGTATGVLLGLFGVELVSSRFSTEVSAVEWLDGAARAGPPKNVCETTRGRPPACTTNAAWCASVTIIAGRCSGLA